MSVQPKYAIIRAGITVDELMLQHINIVTEIASMLLDGSEDTMFPLYFEDGSLTLTPNHTDAPRIRNIHTDESVYAYPLDELCDTHPESVNEYVDEYHEQSLIWFNTKEAIQVWALNALDELFLENNFEKS